MLLPTCLLHLLVFGVLQITLSVLHSAIQPFIFHVLGHRLQRTGSVKLQLLLQRFLCHIGHCRAMHNTHAWLRPVHQYTHKRTKARPYCTTIALLVCKPSTNYQVILFLPRQHLTHDVWSLETHGCYAAAKCHAKLAMLAM